MGLGQDPSCPRLIDEDLGGAGGGRVVSPGLGPRGVAARGGTPHVDPEGPPAQPGQSPVLTLPNSVTPGPPSLDSGPQERERTVSPVFAVGVGSQGRTHSSRANIQGSSTEEAPRLANRLGGRCCPPSALRETQTRATTRKSPRGQAPPDPPPSPKLWEDLVLPAARGAAGTSQPGRETPAPVLVNLRQISRNSSGFEPQNIGTEPQGPLVTVWLSKQLMNAGVGGSGGEEATEQADTRGCWA